MYLNNSPHEFLHFHRRPSQVNIDRIICEAQMSPNSQCLLVRVEGREGSYLGQVIQENIQEGCNWTTDPMNSCTVIVVPLE